jgi:hypothetical protein
MKHIKIDLGYETYTVTVDWYNWIVIAEYREYQWNGVLFVL